MAYKHSKHPDIRGAKRQRWDGKRNDNVLAESGAGGHYLGYGQLVGLPSAISNEKLD